MDKKITSKVETINKLAVCRYNRIWRCTNRNQPGKKCTKVCEYFDDDYRDKEK